MRLNAGAQEISRSCWATAFGRTLPMWLDYPNPGIPSYQGKCLRIRGITLCGSTRFKEQFLEAQKRLTLAGYIVISVGLFGHSGDDEVWTEGTKEMLDDMHKRKIDMADGIYVINVGGYIGQSTRSEIEYALAHGKAVEYLEKP